MKILYVTDVFPPHCGGSGWSVYFFARALRSAGADIRIISLDQTSREYDGFDVRALQLTRSGIPFLDSWKREQHDLPLIADSIRELLPQFDIVHAHHRFSTVAAATAFDSSEALRNSKRLFATIRDYWPVCFCGRSQFRTGTTCDVYDFTRCSEDEKGWKGLASPLVYPWFDARNRRWREMLRHANQLFCISNYVKEQLLPLFPAEQLSVLPNFAEEIIASEVEPLPDRFIFYAGRLEKNKGVQLLPEILKMSRTKIPIVIAGEGSLRVYLENEFREKDVTAHFLGYREYPYMLAVLRRAEFVVFPSLWAEPLGRVLIEAAMMGKPVIAFNHPGGHLDVIEHKRSGLLAGSHEEFGSAVATLESDSVLREVMGAYASQIYENKFSPRAVIPKLLEYYT